MKDVVVLTSLQDIVLSMPLHGRHFPFIFFVVVILTLLLMIVFPSIISLKFLVCLKDIVGPASNVLAIFSVIFHIGISVDFSVRETVSKLFSDELFAIL